VSDWQPIENYPPENTDVIVFVPGARKTKQVGHWGWTMGHDSKLWIIGDQFGFDVGKVTHWMEVPDDPE
jgi:hypothetical protein